MASNNIAVPESVDIARLDTSGAQFDNVDTSERILVYTLQRWNGNLTANAVT